MLAIILAAIGGIITAIEADVLTFQKWKEDHPGAQYAWGVLLFKALKGALMGAFPMGVGVVGQAAAAGNLPAVPEALFWPW